MTEDTAAYAGFPLCQAHPRVAELLAYDASVRSLWPRLSQWMMVALSLSILIPGRDAIKILVMLSAASVSIMCLLIRNDTRKLYTKARHLEESLLHTRLQDTTEVHIRPYSPKSPGASPISTACIPSPTALFLPVFIWRRQIYATSVRHFTSRHWC